MHQWTGAGRFFFFILRWFGYFKDEGCSVNGPRTADRLLVRTVSVGCWTSAVDEPERNSFCYLQPTLVGFWGGLNWCGGSEATAREIRRKSGAFGHVWTSMRKRAEVPGETQGGDGSNVCSKPRRDIFLTIFVKPWYIVGCMEDFFGKELFCNVFGLLFMILMRIRDLRRFY